MQQIKKVSVESPVVSEAVIPTAVTRPDVSEAVQAADRILKASPYAKAINTLRKAKEFIANRNKWIKGNYRVYDGKVCAIGALQSVGGMYRPDEHPEDCARYDTRDWQIAENTLQERARAKGRDCVQALNDNGGTTHEQVLGLFDEAIDDLEKKT